MYAKYYKNSRTPTFKIAKLKANKLGFAIKPSKRKHKKLDVFKDGEYVTSIGDNRYSDFNIHKDKERRKRYKKRHERFRKNKKKYIRSYLSDQILW